MPAHYDGDRDFPTNSGLYWNMGRIYYVISHDGKVFKGSTGTDHIQAAIAFRTKALAEIVKGERQAGTNRVVRIGELLDDYIAKLNRHDQEKGEYGGETGYKTECAINKHVRPFFGTIKAAKLETKHLAIYQDKRIKEYLDAGKPNGSWVIAINRELGYVRTAMRDGMKTTPKKVASVPYFPIDTKAEKLRARKQIIGPEQFETLMRHSAHHLKPALPLVTYSGLRAKEVRFVRRTQVDWPNMVIHLRDGETKEGEGRDIPILDIAVQPLKNWIASTETDFPECPWLFHYQGKQITSWKTAWNGVLRRAGLRVQRKDEDGNPVLNRSGKPMWDNLVRFHDTRRTAITMHDDAGVEEVDSERTTGHKTLRVHRNYNQSKKAAGRTREKMNVYLSGSNEGQPNVKQEITVESRNAAAITQVASLLEKGLITPEVFAATIAKL